MPKTTARKLSDLIHGDPKRPLSRKSVEFYDPGASFCNTIQPFVAHGSRKLDSTRFGTVYRTTAAEDFAYFQSPAKSHDAFGNTTRRHPAATTPPRSPGSPPLTPGVSSPVGYTTFGNLSTGISYLDPRFSVPRPTDTAARDAVSSPSPPLIPPQYRTQISMNQFNEDGYENTCISRFIPRKYGYYSSSFKYMNDLEQIEWKSKKEKKLDKLVEKVTSCCSGCGALGHRFHMDQCRYATYGSQSYIGYAPCYKQR